MARTPSSKLSTGALRDAFARQDQGAILAGLEEAGFSDEPVEKVALFIRRLTPLRMDLSGAKRRTTFLGAVETAIAQMGHADAADRIGRAIEQLGLAEEGYHRISRALDRSNYGALPPLERVAAILARTGFHRENITWEMQEITRSAGFGGPPSMTLRDDEGRPMGVDAMLDQYVSAASVVLGLEGRRHGWMQDGVLVLPDLPTTIPQEQIDAVHDGEYLAQAWNAWRRFEERGRYLSERMLLRDAASEGRDRPVQRVLRLEAGPDDWDLFAAQSRWNELASGVIGSVLTNPEVQRRMRPLWARPAPPPHQFVSVLEALGYSELNVLLGDAPEAEGLRVEGLTVIQWLRGFSCLAVAADAARLVEDAPSTGLTRIAESEVLDLLRLGGLTTEASHCFIRAVTFGERSRDLFDAPLLRLRSGDLAMFGPALETINPGGAIRSAFASRRVEFDQKGEAFEARVRARLSEFGQVFEFKASVNGEPFQYDAIFVWGDYVFVFECKNRRLPGEEPIQGRWFLDEVRQGVRQTNRLAQALARFARELRERHGLDLQGKIIVPCLLNNLPFARAGTTDGCYVYDFIALDRLLSSRYLNMKVLQTVGASTAVEVLPVIKLWAKATPSPSDLIADMKDPVQLRIMRAHAGPAQSEIMLDEETVALSPEFVVEPTSPESFAGLGGVSSVVMRQRLRRAGKRLDKQRKRAERRRP